MTELEARELVRTQHLTAGQVFLLIDHISKDAKTIEDLTAKVEQYEKEGFTCCSQRDLST